jgi:hypothetical protein
MKIWRYGLFACLGLSATFFITAQRVQATLGESANSIASDNKTLSAVRRATSVHNGYTVQEIYSDATTVREYVSPSGVVFAIAWNGLIHPDLTPLLGSYASEYQEAIRKTPRNPGHRSLRVKTSRLVVEKWGHMRNLQGRAYAPALIPLGVTIYEIR